MKYRYIVSSDSPCYSGRSYHIADRPLTAAEVLEALGPEHPANHNVSKSGRVYNIRLERFEDGVPSKVQEYIESVGHLDPQNKTLAVSAVAHMLDCDWDKAKTMIKKVLGAEDLAGPFKVKTANFLRCVKSRWVAQRWLITEAVIAMEGGLYDKAIEKINQFYASDTADSLQD